MSFYTRYKKEVSHAQMINNLLEIKNLTTRFHLEEGVVRAVNGISYKMKEGETLGVVGESGCGKSVHALSILRLIPIPPGKIEKGEVWFAGRDLLTLDDNDMRLLRGSDIAMVFQDPMTSLNPVFTVGEQITEALVLHKGLDDEAADDRAAELLDMVGIPDAGNRLNDYPHQFSGGMRQRAMLAMALSCDPRLLIADEPTTALDVTIQAQIVHLVKRLQELLGMAVMWITHDLGLVAELAQTINVMYAGYIVERGDVLDIYKRPRHPYTIGLLGSLPRLDEAPGTKLISIPGQPPDLIELSPGCPFAERCGYKVDQCVEQMPSLSPTDDINHIVACWRWEDVAGRKIL
jgi:oligopeptide transport system ATP-binding protein